MYQIPNYKKILKNLEKWRVDAYRFTENGKRVWRKKNERTQWIIPKDPKLLDKLGIKKSENILFIAGYYGTWANALAELGTNVIYTEGSEELVGFAKNKYNENKNILDFICRDLATIPQEPQQYDWTVSFEPVSDDIALPIAVLRSLLNKKGIIIIHYPRKLVPRDKFLNYKIIAQVYNCEFLRKEVFIDGFSNHYLPLSRHHLITSLITNEIARSQAKIDIRALESGTFTKESFTRLNKISNLFDQKYLKTNKNNY